MRPRKSGRTSSRPMLPATSRPRRHFPASWRTPTWPINLSTSERYLFVPAGLSQRDPTPRMRSRGRRRLRASPLTVVQLTHLQKPKHKTNTTPKNKQTTQKNKKHKTTQKQTKKKQDVPVPVTQIGAGALIS